MAGSSKVVSLRTKSKAAPSIENGKVPPPRRKNSELRSREYLTPDEVERIVTEGNVEVIHAFTGD